MYAIVEISGKQFKVEKKQKIFVNKLDVAEGKKVSFDNVLMINDGSKSSIGTPKVSGAQVDAKVLKHLKSDKVIVFKKKRRKGYKVKNGHRQAITEIEISDILTGGTQKKTSTKKDVVYCSLEDLKDFVKKIEISSVAIGGINLRSFQKVKRSGVDMIAMSSELFLQNEIPELEPFIEKDN